GGVRCTAPPRADAGYSSGLRRDQLFVYLARVLISEWRRRWQFGSRALNHSRPWRRQRLQALALKLEARQRDLAGGPMHACVGDLAQPGADPGIGGVAIDLESFGRELARERNVEAPAQIADEAFDLALGLGSIRPAQPRHEAVVVCEVEEGAVVTVQPWTVLSRSVTTVRMLSYSTSRGTPPKK